MPHQRHQRKFGRETAHRTAMLRNLTVAVLRYERVKTTEAKAKEVRRFVDRMIMLGKDGSLAARRRALAWLPEPEIVEKVFSELAPRFATRTSGFARTVRLGRRVGDSAPLMLIELIEGVAETPASEEEAKPRRRLGLRRRSSVTADVSDTPAKASPRTRAARGTAGAGGGKG